jgi:hypothetical protein
MHLDFSYRATKDGKVLIAWHGKPIVTLKGGKAKSFIEKTSVANEEQQQLLMARATGNFKHGNERVGKRSNR